MRNWFVKRLLGSTCLALVAAVSVTAQDAPSASAPINSAPIKRLLPPEGIALPTDVHARLTAEVIKAKERFAAFRSHPQAADVAVLLKGVAYALELREFYDLKDVAKADALLKEANLRMDQLAAGNTPWLNATGTTVRGFFSEIDGSPQPYGVVIPKNFDFKQPAPLYIWLHGRGDKQTDLHFIHERLSKPGQITPPDAIVIHVFGRQCVGYKHAGEVDVIEAATHAEQQYKTDPTRRVLIGFSMGGAGAWHVGAHYAHLFRVVAPGAGFAETAKYQRLKPEEFPNWYEQKLWGHYDTPGYVRNLFNTETIAYSGELDRQIQAARVMEAAFETEGRKLTHLIGPKTEHKYEPNTLKDLLSKIDAALKAPADDPPKRVHLQTRTLRYHQQDWVIVFRLQEHWLDSRIDAELDGSAITITTKNIAFFGFMLPKGVHDKGGLVQIKVDGQSLEYKRRTRDDAELCGIFNKDGKWAVEELDSLLRRTQEHVKRIESHGPIDDAFCSKFFVVTPSGKSKNGRFQAWQEFELNHFRDRWRALMRGEFREVKDTAVTDAMMSEGHLILWGDADSNSVIKKLADQFPIKRSGDSWSVGAENYSAETHVPVMIYPNPLDKNWPPKYVVFNSGLTFREAHDRTNSLQNPKLPDWAIIDITTPPDASAPGKVVNAGFFDEQWQLKPVPKP